MHPGLIKCTVGRSLGRILLSDFGPSNWEALNGNCTSSSIFIKHSEAGRLIGKKSKGRSTWNLMDLSVFFMEFPSSPFESTVHIRALHGKENPGPLLFSTSVGQNHGSEAWIFLNVHDFYIQNRQKQYKIIVTSTSMNCNVKIRDPELHGAAIIHTYGSKA